MDQPKASPLFRFGLFEADPQNCLLTRKGVRVRLQEQPFRVLALFLARPGQIVLRDELRQNLWPSGTYVDFDGSLNAALKRLREALNDDADNPRFIETVPKRGYRFIAPVTVENSLAHSEAPAPAPALAAPSRIQPSKDLSVSPFRLPSLRRTLALAAVVAAIAVAAILVLRKRAAVVPPPSPRAAVDAASLQRSVAVLGFQNASGRPGDAWLSTALAEMLRTELGAGGKLRVISGENVAQFRLDSPWSETDSLSQPTASRIGKVLNSDLLVLGSFAAVGDPQNGSVRVDFRLQNAQSGEILYEGAETGSEKQFFGLVAKVGVALRERLGLPMVTESEEVGVVSSLPSNLEADRFYSLALEKMNDEDVATAKDLFLQAEQMAPDFPLVHLMLARAWGDLGYDQKSREEAKKAFDLSGSLPETDKLLVQGAYYSSRKDLARAATVYRALSALYPDSVDYGIRLVDTLHAEGRREEALAVINRLRQLPSPASDDPTIDFAEALVDGDLNVPQSNPLLDRAVAKAAARGQKLLYARFRLQQCIALVYGSHPQGAVAHCQEAYDIFMAAGNTLLAADALRTIGDRRGAIGDFAGARDFYHRALTLLGKLGEHEKIGVVFNNMAITYENQGLIDQSEKLFRQAAQSWKECGDTQNEAVALGNLGDVYMERGQLRQAENQYQNARKQIEVANPVGVAYELDSIASLRLAEGDMAGATQYADHALAMAHARADVIDTAAASSIIGDIQRAADDLRAARQSYQQTLAVEQQLGDLGGVAEAQASLASVSIEEGDLAGAEAVLTKSLAEFRAEKSVLNEVSADADLSRVLLREGKLADARRTISEALALSNSSRDPALKSPVAIEDARIEVAELASRTKTKLDLAAPRRKLLDVLSTAQRLGYYGIECDARLALGELELRLDPAAARAHLAELARDAHNHGFNLVARKAASLQRSSVYSANPSPNS